MPSDKVYKLGACQRRKGATIGGSDDELDKREEACEDWLTEAEDGIGYDGKPEERRERERDEREGANDVSRQREGDCERG